MKDDSQLHAISRTLGQVARAMCHRSEEYFQIYEEQRDGGIQIKISPHMGDFRLLVGSNGRQSKAFRAVALAMAKRYGLRPETTTCILEESFVGDRQERHEAARVDFTEDDFYDALLPVVRLALGDVRITTAAKMGRKGPKLVAYVDVNEEDTSTVVAISDLFFVVGMRNGIRLEVDTLNSQYEREQRKRRAGVA